MRPVRLEIKNFRGWRECVLPLDRTLTIVVGDNARGKSSAMNAIEWCLFGREVEKASSGIAERADWEVHHRGAPGTGTEVTLALVKGKSETRIRRRRDADAGAREEDQLTIELSSGEQIVQQDAEAWIQKSGLPDWETWRRACCQHQEILRSRLTEKSDRSSVLTSLLGLEDHDRYTSLLREAHPEKLIKQLDLELEELEKDVLFRLRQPAEEIDECEQRLAGLGIENARLGPALAVEVGRAMIERARALGARLGVPVEPPPFEGEVDEPALLAWAKSWPAAFRKEARVPERLSSLTKKRAGILSEVEQLRPLEERHRLAREKLSAEVRERGNEETQKQLLVSAEASLKAAEGRVRGENQTQAILRDTLDVLRVSEDPEQCPVCDTRVQGLADRIQVALGKGVGGRGGAAARLAALERERKDAQARRDTLERTMRALAKLVQDEADARKGLEEHRGKLAALISPGRIESNGDLLAGAREEEEAMGAEIPRLEGATLEIDQSLEEFRKDVEKLRELARWRTASKRAEQKADLASAPAWGSLQKALDQAATHAVDLEALGAMARAAQAERSAEREGEVNRSLSEILGLIAGPEARMTARVSMKETARNLTFDLEDATGERVLSTLNQAALNAISLALLFAQAEERAKAGVPTWVVLDDPGQSLDTERQDGLARAIERLARSCPVVVATTPGRLAERLLSATSSPRRAIRLAARDPSGAARIEPQEERG